MLTEINVLFASFILQQARNQEFFRAGEFSSNLGSSTFTYNTRKKSPAGKKSTVFSLRNS